MQHIHSTYTVPISCSFSSNIFSSVRCQPKTFKEKIQTEKLPFLWTSLRRRAGNQKCMHALENQLEIDGIQFGRNQSAFHLINRQISIPFYFIILNATTPMEMEMDTRSENYIFISFRWKITVIYCFVACPLNEWFFLCPKVRRRFVVIVFALWFWSGYRLRFDEQVSKWDYAPLYKQFQKEIMTSA